MEFITEHPIVPAALHPLLATRGSGSVIFHYAVVKEQQSKGGGGATIAIQYQADGDVAAELKVLANELKARWELEDVLLVRRIGTLTVGEIISLIAVSSPRSEDAFAAAQEGISRMKKMKTVKKNERYA